MEENEKLIIKKIAALSAKLARSIERFEPANNYRDKDWKFYLKLKRKWILFGAKEYDNKLYFFSDCFENYVFDLKTEKVEEVRNTSDLLAILPKILEALKEVYSEVLRDPICYHKNLAQSISPLMRKGLIHRSFVRSLLPEWLRYDQELGAKNVQAMISLIEDYGCEDCLEQMTAGKYFEYCKVAYLANKSHSTKEMDTTASGRDLYIRWADGRDGGLREVDLDSKDSFLNWYDSGSRAGGHPWEIYRGGNTTHIDLYVEKFADKWRVCLSAHSSGRLAETCRIALAFKKAGLPFKLNYEKSYLQRLRCDDLVGVIPEYDSVHRGWQRFPDDFVVADCIQFSWFKDEKNRWIRRPKELSALVHWLPERPQVLRS